MSTQLIWANKVRQSYIVDTFYISVFLAFSLALATADGSKTTNAGTVLPAFNTLVS